MASRIGKKKYEAKEQEEDQLLKVGYIQNMDLSKSISIESDIDEKDHASIDTPMEDKLERMKRGTHKSQVAKRKKIKDVRNCNDLWKWYWQHPIGHLPLFYYVLCFIFAIIFIPWFFMDPDTAFILCGMIGLIMSAYSSFKFKISIALKKEVDKYRTLNIKFRRENRKLTAEVKRVKKARKTLKKTKRRLAIANIANRDNLKKFEQIEDNMRVAGENAIKGMSSAYNTAIAIRKKWREEFLANEREMLQAVYNRYERKHTNKSNLGMTASDFEQFQELLPRRYKTRFARMGTFHNLAVDSSMIDYQEFANALDVFAQMEVDQMDLEVNITPRHQRKKPLERFSVGDIADQNVDSNTPSPMASP